jgi:alpha-L-fucosidase
MCCSQKNLRTCHFLGVDKTVHGDAGLLLEFTCQVIIRITRQMCKILDGWIVVDIHPDVIDAGLNGTGNLIVVVIFRQSVMEFLVSASCPFQKIPAGSGLPNLIGIEITDAVGNRRWQTAFGSDKEGDKAGIPYDGHLTLADGKGKWWEGYDPRLLYGIDLREYETVEERAHSPWSPPNPGVFWRHLDYAKWYTTQWALRIMDVTANYDPDFIYTDGTVQGPFTGDGTGTGYKCNAMQTVMADYYNRTLKNRGEVNTFTIIKFRNPTNGTVTTAEFDYPSEINTSQPWIRETPIGDWFYSPGFHYEASMMIRAIIESISRDGNIAINICLRPDGSIEEAAVTMLEELGQWMNVNGEAVYGSHAWKVPAEGELVNGKLRKLPGGGLHKWHAEYPFSAQDIRFTRGKSGHVYAFCMASPEGGQTIRIHSMGKQAGHMGPVEQVSLLGYDGQLQWVQTEEALEIQCPDTLPFATSVVFRVSEAPVVE